MFDFAPDRRVDDVPPQIIDADSLACLLAMLDDDEAISQCGHAYAERHELTPPK